MIDLLPDDEQQALIDSAADFLKRRMTDAHPESALGLPDTMMRSLWKECGALGWFAIGLERGAEGDMSIVEETLLSRELGRQLMPVPFIATMVATRLAAECGATDLSRDLASGELVVGL